MRKGERCKHSLHEFDLVGNKYDLNSFSSYDFSSPYHRENVRKTKFMPLKFLAMILSRQGF